MDIEIHYKPLSELKYHDTFKDEYGNVYEVSDEEDESGTAMYLTPVGGNASSRRFIGKIRSDGTYTKFEEERHRYFKENAWTVNHAMLKRAAHVVYETDSRQYSIDVQFALDKGRKLTLNSEEKIVLPVKWWDVKAFDRVENRRIELMGVEWTDALTTDLNKGYMKELAQKVNHARNSSLVYPANQDVFKALKLTNLSDVKVVILGQDPYPKEYANGLAFGMTTTNVEQPIPYSLRQLFEELNREQQQKGFLPGVHDVRLENWARQGVLLLNTRLTVGSKPGSHKGWGWEYFTTRIMEIVNQSPTPVVFMLWGSEAGSYARLVDKSYHLVLNAPHPAASAYPDYKGAPFVGCGHFSRAFEFVKKHYNKEIQW